MHGLPETTGRNAGDVHYRDVGSVRSVKPVKDIRSFFIASHSVNNGIS